MQEKLKSGDRVKHATRIDWGLGQVLAEESGNRIKVYFEDVGAKEFTLEFAKFIRVFGEEAQSDYLTALVNSYQVELNKPTPSGNPKIAFTTFPKAVEIFLSYFPSGFQDKRYLEGASGERQCKVSAHQLMLELLGQKAFSELLQEGYYSEIIDRATSVMNKANLIQHYEKIWFASGNKTSQNHYHGETWLADEDEEQGSIPGEIRFSNGMTEADQKKFAESLFDLLYGSAEMRARFERFSAMVYDIPFGVHPALKAANWPVTTYFLFIAFPAQHMLFNEVTKSVANILGVGISYKPELNWLTYGQVLEFAELIHKKLCRDGREILVPRDMIDIQSFFWVISPSYLQ